VAKYSSQPGAPNLISISSTPDAITARFQRPIDPATLSFKLLDFNGNPIPASVTYTETPPTATLKPRDILRSGFTYSAVVSALDASGNAAGPTVATFKTPEPTVTAKDYSFWDHSTSPACSEASDDKSVEVGVQFTADVPGLITGIRFFRLPGAYGPY